MVKQRSDKSQEVLGAVFGVIRTMAGAMVGGVIALAFVIGAVMSGPHESDPWGE
ncbi:sodium/proton-translocating pyrophosphatase [Rhodococcus jostii]|uniref:Uncharacterized protein n=1 Tax=Rhodococcus jostii TaxID=132919 RepID=A0A1H5MP42_RHOJO|nr:sodium/proton-translocating pyrophosphatase [Rhodococcus jostii]SEE91119.1 hypothetical protein SAMN04490220_9178 [Rhodococcus jostii]